MTFDEAFDRLIGHEGGYANHPEDPGGETMFGVTAHVARANGFTGNMRDLPRDRAKAIYRENYWTPVRADQLRDDVRFDVFDGAVNSGAGQSIKWLQQALSVPADGILGPQTLQAMDQADGGLPGRFNGARLLFMTNLPTWGSFGRGWSKRIASNLIGT